MVKISEGLFRREGFRIFCIRCTDAPALIPQPGSSARIPNKVYICPTFLPSAVFPGPTRSTLYGLVEHFASLLTSAKDFRAELPSFGLITCFPPPVIVLWSLYVYPVSYFEF